VVAAEVAGLIQPSRECGHMGSFLIEEVQLQRLDGVDY
jgi:hypothetical protein